MIEEVGGKETNAAEFMCLCGYMVVADSISQSVYCSVVQGILVVLPVFASSQQSCNRINAEVPCLKLPVRM